MIQGLSFIFPDLVYRGFHRLVKKPPDVLTDKGDENKSINKMRI